MAKTAAPGNRNLRKEENSRAISSTNQAKRNGRSRTMNGHVKDEEPVNGRIKREEPEDLVVPSSSTETENGEAGESIEEVEEGGGGENGKIASEEDEEEVLVEKINGYIRKGKKEEVKNQGKTKRRKEDVEAEGKIDDALYKFPMNRVSRIIRSEISNVRLSQEAVFVINRASEKFLELFSREAYACAFLDRKSYIAYDHLSSVVSKRKRFDFVSDFIPERVKAEDALTQISESEK
ncbi:uncharacterized protein [Primulina eburnea]|uniref:uncharacterized protein isoform X1 n=1 Tax=Primulina eburnea TaxID=1245227 RepID=UPI003C6C4D99